MPTTRFCLIRHGETDWNTARRIQGHRDIPLNARGRAQAEALAQHLAGAGAEAETFDALYSSDLARAWQTAQALAATLQLAARAHTGLRERHYGVLEGQTAASARARHPAHHAAHAAHAARATNHDLDGGETLANFAARVSACFADLARQHSGQSLLLVTHGGVLDIVYRLANGRDLSGPRDFPVPNAGINRLEYCSGIWALQSWGETGHLEAALDEVV